MLVGVQRKARGIQITTYYNCGEQKSISECIKHQILRQQQQNTTSDFIPISQEKESEATVNTESWRLVTYHLFPDFLPSFDEVMPTVTSDSCSHTCSSQITKFSILLCFSLECHFHTHNSSFFMQNLVSWHIVHLALSVKTYGQLQL